MIFTLSKCIMLTKGVLTFFSYVYNKIKEFIKHDLFMNICKKIYTMHKLG